MSKEKSPNKKKTMYVPDKELLSYNKAKEDDVSDNNDNIENIETVAEDNITPKDDIVKDIAKEETESVAESVDVVKNADIENQEIDKEEAKTPTKQKKKNIFLRILCAIFPSKGNGLKIIIVKSVAIIAAIALVISGTYLARYFYDIGVQDAKIENVRNSYELNRDDYSKNEDNQFSKFDHLKLLNQDVIGWITIPNTEVDNPFYQTSDNEYYVTHDMDKQTNTYGALFLDYRCNINPISVTQNQIIYGHNMRYGAMFGMLDEYRNIDFYKSNPVIYVDTLYEKCVYKIFAIMIVNDSEDETFGYSFSAYRTRFTDEDDVTNWIQYCKDRSLYDIPVDVDHKDQFITLSTCCYDYDNARFVLVGRLVRDENESTTVDTSLAVKNEDVIYSKEYYDKKGMSVPKLNVSTPAK